MRSLRTLHHVSLGCLKVDIDVTFPQHFSLPPVDGKWADSGDGERHAVMNVLVAANRFGFKVLAQQCERKLSLNLEYVKNCKIIPTLSIFWN